MAGSDSCALLRLLACLFCSERDYCRNFIGCPVLEIKKKEEASLRKGTNMCEEPHNAVPHPGTSMRKQTSRAKKMSMPKKKSNSYLKQTKQPHFALHA